MDPALAELKERLGVITDLERTQSVLHWDSEVWMPPGGASGRSLQLSTLESVLHGRWTEDRLGELLDELEPYRASLAGDHDDACLLRVARRLRERATRVPAELAAELVRVQSEAHHAWVKARASADFGAFRPWLEQLLELVRRRAEHLAPDEDPYDVQLDDFEEGLRADEVRAIFDTLEPELTALVAAHASDEDDFPPGPYSLAAQDRLSRELVELMGADWGAFRFDVTVHPFMTAFGLSDIRLTTRYSDGDLHSLFTAMHECGHGLYEWGIDPALDRTPLAGGTSSTLHESQSRLWENVVGRSLPFWRWFYPRVQKAFPNQLGDVPVERFFRAYARPRRSYIRTDADETSYGLHVILRFELEEALVAGRLAVADLPEAWNARFEELLGIKVPNDRLGVLQDSHWAAAGFGYFPTYLLGSVVAVQFWDAARAAIPDVEEQIGRGELAGLHEWLRDNLYALGGKFTVAETLERVVGGPLDPQPYLGYLRDKLESLSTTAAV